MSNTVSDLADLRRQIDDIDDRIHELLIARAEIVGAVAASKKAGGGDGDVAFYQPAREAEILRRLSRRHRGALPFGSIARIWRELLAATVRLETRLTVAVLASPEAPGIWDLARDHYGSQTPVLTYGATSEVIRAVGNAPGMVGVLPMPRENDPDPWWPRLVPSDFHTLRVIARLPFAARGNARGEGDALVIGHGIQQPTGADRTLFALRLGFELSRARIFRLLESSDLPCSLWMGAECADDNIYLLEFDGFVGLADPRLARLRGDLDIPGRYLVPVGGYALPLSQAALPSGAKG